MSLPGTKLPLTCKYGPPLQVHDFTLVGQDELAVQQTETGGGGEESIDLTGTDLIEGDLFVVVREMWEDVKGFEVWEIKGQGDKVKNGVLVDEAMLDRVYARKWVHEASLMEKGSRKAKPVDLPDKSSAPTMLALPSERRFAPRNGRQGNFGLVEPSCHGETWMKIGGEKLEKYHDTFFGAHRVSFVFRTQEQHVTKAYSILNRKEEEDDEEE